MKNWKRFIPIGIILALMALVYFTGFYKVFTFDKLRQHYFEMQDFVENNPYTTPLIFICIYMISTTLSLPGALFLSLLGGFLFPIPFSTIYVLIGATAGATCLFLAARTSIGAYLKEKAGPRLKKMEKGFKKNAASYLLFLRFIPFFPFWIVNLAPAFFNVRLFTFVWTTFVGIAPGAYALTQTGRGLGAIFESGEELNVKALFNPQIQIALVVLAIFSLLPILIKKLREKKT